ncbi:hypothetical protein DD237_002259 [Peronospora effusa]|nr:hypothetical protein DD237_002259 [Peronospora effusa]
MDSGVSPFLNAFVNYHHKPEDLSPLLHKKERANGGKAANTRRLIKRPQALQKEHTLSTACEQEIMYRTIRGPFGYDIYR